jgi:hypothetical protein
MNDLNHTIERRLMAAFDWISASQLCREFDINERTLRGEDGMLRHCAISGDKGYKHILRATDEEFVHWSVRLRQHAIQELTHVREMRKKRTSDRQLLFKRKIQSADYAVQDFLPWK